MRRIAAALCTVLTVFGLAVPQTPAAATPPPSPPPPLPAAARADLLQVAADTWRFFADKRSGQ